MRRLKREVQGLESKVEILTLRFGRVATKPGNCVDTREHMPKIGTRVKVKIPSGVFSLGRMSEVEIEEHNEKYNTLGTIIAVDEKLRGVDVRWDDGMSPQIMYNWTWDKLEYA